MTSSHITSTTDPINGFDITDPKDWPCVVECDNNNDLTVYFENNTTRQAYVDVPVEHPEQDSSKSLSNPSDDCSG